MASATTRSLNAQRSSMEPPPRVTEDDIHGLTAQPTDGGGDLSRGSVTLDADVDERHGQSWEAAASVSSTS
jgi:hypothetical protein